MDKISVEWLMYPLSIQL